MTSLVKFLFITFLFYFFALLQNSFFIHYNIFGNYLNLVFILFFLLVFFAGKNKNQKIIVFSLLSGILLDFFSYSKLGISIALFLIIGFSLKCILSLLKNKKDNIFPFSYFLPLFFIFFILYEILLMTYLHFFDLSHPLFIFDLKIILGAIYNLFFAVIGFWIFKKIKKNA